MKRTAKAPGESSQGEMWIAVTVDGMIKCASRERGTTAEGEVPEEMDGFLARGYVVKKVPYAEYVAMSEADYVAQRSIKQRAINAQPVAVPMEVSIKDIPTQGLRVRVRIGECFDGEIEWEPAEDFLMVASADCNPNGEKGVALQPIEGGEGGWGYAGYERGTKTWWRYREEAKPGAYREHCMQVLAVL